MNQPAHVDPTPTIAPKGNATLAADLAIEAARKSDEAFAAACPEAAAACRVGPDTDIRIDRALQVAADRLKNPPTAAKPRPPVTKEEAGKLLNTAIDLDRQADFAEQSAATAEQLASEARKRATVLGQQSARAWGVARMALRCYSRKRPMPDNAGEVQLQLADETFGVPEDAKVGDTVVDPRTGRKYRIHAGPEGDLFAFPCSNDE